jgi:hypothetical protein
VKNQKKKERIKEAKDKKTKTFSRGHSCFHFLSRVHASKTYNHPLVDSHVPSTIMIDRNKIEKRHLSVDEWTMTFSLMLGGWVRGC